MTDAGRALRSAPKPIRRLTLNGSDQFVLACAVRRDATDVAFPEIERLEHNIRELTRIRDWKREHTMTRTARYIRTRLFITGCTVATTLATVGFFLFNVHGKEFRVVIEQAVEHSRDSTRTQLDGNAPLVRDIPQGELDSLASVVAREARAR